MENPSIDQLLEIMGDRYSLVAATSIRARQIVEGEQYDNQVSFLKPVSTASKEIFEGKVKYIKL